MTRTAEEICHAMNRVRSDARQDVAEIKDSVEAMFSWRYYVERHPLAFAAAAAAVGFVLAPKSRRQSRDLAKLVWQLRDEGGLSPKELAAALGRSTSWSQGLLGAAGPPLVRVAIALASNYFLNRGSSSPHPEQQEPVPDAATNPVGSEG